MPRSNNEARQRIHPLAVVAAGLLAGCAYLAAMGVDLRLVGNRTDDRIMLGRPLARDPRRARAVGTAAHFANSVAFAALYARVESWLPGPPWLRGVLAASAENLLLYPVTSLQRFHPAYREGLVGSYWTWAAFLQSVARHAAFGAVLGAAHARFGCRWLVKDRRDMLF